MSRHSYLILAHKDWVLFSKLLRCLDDPRNTVFIHIDKKAAFSLSEVYEPHRAEYVYIPRRRVSWGGFSQVEAELALLEAATTRGFDYYHLLSGQDLPIKSQDYIYDFFDNQSQDNSYIGFSFTDLDTLVSQRLGQYHFLQEIIGCNSSKQIQIIKDLEDRSLDIQRRLKINRVANYPFKVYKGSNWFSINHELARYVLSRKKEIKKRFKNSKCADELFLQTISKNSPFKHNIVPSNLREIDWIRGAPYTYRKADYSMLLASDKLFARKFSTETDSEIIEMIFSHIMNEQNCELLCR